jgi:hypothetical protein
MIMMMCLTVLEAVGGGGTGGVGVTAGVLPPPQPLRMKGVDKSIVQSKRDMTRCLLDT